jgi:hypothetical protein
LSCLVFSSLLFSCLLPSSTICIALFFCFKTTPCTLHRSGALLSEPSTCLGSIPVPVLSCLLSYVVRFVCLSTKTSILSEPQEEAKTRKRGLRQDEDKDKDVPIPDKRLILALPCPFSHAVNLVLGIYILATKEKEVTSSKTRAKTRTRTKDGGRQDTNRTKTTMASFVTTPLEDELGTIGELKNGCVCLVCYIVFCGIFRTIYLVCCLCLYPLPFSLSFALCQN